MCSAAAEIADKVEAFLRVRVDGPNMGVQVLPLCLDTSYRTVHLDIVELAVIDQTAKKTRFDFFEELYFLVIVLKTVADDILFNGRTLLPGHVTLQATFQHVGIPRFDTFDTPQDFAV